MASYVPATSAERQEMLAALGLASEDELFAQIPPEARAGALDLPAGISELEVAAELESLAARDTVFASCFRGAGAYRHYVPAVVRSVTSKEEFVTAYTPYQAEISQGVLQSIFEYQTQVCELFGMDVANASVYDGATAAAEGVLMCEERRRSGVVLAGAVDPQVAAVVRTYCQSRGVAVHELPAGPDLAADPGELAELLATTGAASVLVQSPNYYGVIEDVDGIVAAAHATRAKAVVSTNPISLGLLRTPGECGADVAVAEGQPLGLPLSFGGPYLGIMCCTKALMRRLPGRIVGQTTDARGTRCFVLTLQAREQHIRREKASSNICSNEALCAMTASVYLAAMGPRGLRRAAEGSAANAHYLAARLAELGFVQVSRRAFFHEFLTGVPAGADARALMDALAGYGILGGLPVEGPGGPGILWCCTELNRRAQVDALVSALGEILDTNAADGGPGAAGGPSAAGVPTAAAAPSAKKNAALAAAREASAL